MKGLIYLGALIGSLLGSYIPVFLGASWTSVVSILGGLVGAIAGVWAAVRFGQNI